jgi:CRP/FNR family cyclic AMP-dependent transcriptional regulator
MEDLAILRQIPYFANLEEKDLHLLAEVGHEETFAPGGTILEEGEVQNSLYFIVAGQVKVCLEKISGRKLTLSNLERGDLFGEDCLLGEGRPSPKVVALEETTVIRIAKDDFLRGISNDPVILGNILRNRSSNQIADHGNEIQEEGRFQREVSIFEKRFNLELEGIKLISKKIEEISDETIARVDKRTAEAIELSERRSKEVTDHSEKEAKLAIEAAKETIAISMEEGKIHTEAAIAQVNAALHSVKSETEAFWKNINTWRQRLVYILAVLISVLGFLGYQFGYHEFKQIMQIRAQLLKDKEVIEKVRRDVEKANEKFVTKLPQLSALNAMVLEIGRISREAGLKGDDIERFKQVNMNYNENRKQLLYYITSYEDEDNQPEVAVEAVNNFLKLIEFNGDDKILGKENSDILESCLKSLTRIREKLEKERDFRYRLKVRDNLIHFGQILQKNYLDFYNIYFKPTMTNYFPELDFHAKTTLAEALVILGEKNKAYTDQLTSVMQTSGEKVSDWRKYGAAVALMHINDKKAHDYLFAEMQPYKKNRLMVAILLGEALVRNNAIKLDKADLQKISDCLKEGTRDDPNKFRRDYANAVLTGLNQARPVQK